MSVSPDQACVYHAEVMHQRFFSAAYRFRYRVFSLLLDIDAIERVAAGSRVFSHNRFNLLSFHDADHLPPGEHSLRGWAERVLAADGIDGSRLRIRLLCFPRVLGLVFNPLSLWYCERADGQPAAVIAEVRNTFGERHCYLLRPRRGGAEWPLRDSHAKDFHVSPFIGMHARYDFRLSRPDRQLRVAIREYQGDRLMLVATQTGERRPFTSAELLRQALRVPLQTLKVVAAIHWQALKIWRQGERFHRKPAPPMHEVSKNEC
jgi:DUF1365 family protein